MPQKHTVPHSVRIYSFPHVFFSVCVAQLSAGVGGCRDPCSEVAQRGGMGWGLPPIFVCFLGGGGMGVNADKWGWVGWG